MSHIQDIRLILKQVDDDVFRIRFEDIRCVTRSVCEGIDATVTVKHAHGDTLLGDSGSGTVS